MQEQTQETTPAVEETTTTPDAPALTSDETGNIISRCFERDVTMSLQEKDVAAYGREAAALEEEISEIEKEFSEVKKDFSDRIKKKEAVMRSVLQKIREGQTTQLVMVKEVRNYSDATVKIFVGPDYTQLHEERAMQGDEFQKDLFIRTSDEKESEPETMAEEQKEFEEAQPEKDYDLRDHIRDETRVSTKHSSVDGPRAC